MNSLKSHEILRNRRSKSINKLLLIKEINKNPNYFYKYTKQFSKESNKIADLKIADEFLTDDKDKANTLHRQYKSVWSNPVMDLYGELISFFFSDCELCKNEKVHQCKFDEVPSHNREFREKVLSMNSIIKQRKCPELKYLIHYEDDFIKYHDLCDGSLQEWRQGHPQ